MKAKLIAAVFLFATPLGFTTAPDSRSTDKVKESCTVWAAVQIPENRGDTEEERFKNVIYANACASYISGLSTEMSGELSWLDETHKKVVVGNWEDGVTTKQQILIFLDYANQNPATLNKPANSTFRKSVEAAGIYIYSAP
jgi:hypothetical protein